MTTKLKDETGKRYGWLQVIKRMPRLKSTGNVYWYCHCDCGNTVIKKGTALRKRIRLDCGKCYYEGQLTQKYLRHILYYDPQTGIFTRKIFRGSAAQPGDVAGTTTTNGYIDIVINGEHHLAHRLAWFWIHGEWPPKNIDHINRNKTDNRLCNLRLADHHENAKNMKRRIDNSSGHPGICWSKRHKKWRAYITIKGKQIYLGRFSEKKQAIKARQKAEKEHGFHPISE